METIYTTLGHGLTEKFWRNFGSNGMSHVFIDAYIYLSIYIYMYVLVVFHIVDLVCFMTIVWLTCSLGFHTNHVASSTGDHAIAAAEAPSS